jgi:hypothetical protein
VHATGAAFVRIVGDILETPVDYRLERIELLLQLFKWSFPTSSRRSPARSPVPPPAGVRTLIPSASHDGVGRSRRAFTRLTRTIAACSCHRVAWSPVSRTIGPRPPDRARLGLKRVVGNRDGPALGLATGIRLFHRTWSTCRPATPTAGSGWLTGHPGRRLSLCRVFAGGHRPRVWLTAFVYRNIGAQRRLLRHVARRPTTAAAMTPGFWRLSISLAIDLRVLNLTARR